MRLEEDNYREVACCLKCDQSKEPFGDLCECLEGFKADNKLVYKYFICNRFRKK